MLAIKLAGQRRLSGAVPGLLRLAGDADAAVGDAALKVLTDLAGPAEVPALIGVLQATQARAPAERALLAAASRGEGRGAGDIVVRRAVYGKLPDGPQQEVTKKVEQLLATGVREFVASNEQFGDTAPGLVKQFTIEFTQAGRPGRLTVNEHGKVEFPPAGMAPAAVSALCDALPAAGGEVKLALLRILRVSGSDQALARVRAAAGGDDAALREAAQRLLCDWPADNGLPAVRELAAGATDPKIKILALRGLIRLIPASALSVEQKAEELGQVSKLATRTEEKLQVVAALGEVHAEKSLVILEALAADPELKQAADLAAAAVRAKLSAGGK